MFEITETFKREQASVEASLAQLVSLPLLHSPKVGLLWH